MRCDPTTALLEMEQQQPSHTEQQQQQRYEPQRYEPQHYEQQQQQQPAIRYGDLRVCTDRRKGTCLFWVVPDVAPGFNVPNFYEDFVVERREHVRARLEREAQQRADAKYDVE